MGCDVKVGNKVPLSAQIECPDATVFYVRAFIFDQSNNQLDTRDLVDRGDGRFENFSYTMPNLDFVSVQYRVFDDNTYTNQLEEPCPATEVFKKLEEVGGGGGSAVAGIQAVGKVLNKIIQGKVVASGLVKGKIATTNITGRVKPYSLIKGKILYYTIKGRVSCKN